MFERVRFTFLFVSPPSDVKSKAGLVELGRCLYVPSRAMSSIDLAVNAQAAFSINIFMISELPNLELQIISIALIYFMLNI